jgi:hypothetical protein
LSGFREGRVLAATVLFIGGIAGLRQAAYWLSRRSANEVHSSREGRPARTVPGSRDGQSQQPTPAAGRARRKRSWTPAAVFLAVAVSALAWLSYLQATPPVPVSDFQGAVAVFIYGNVSTGNVNVDVAEPAKKNSTLFVSVTVKASPPTPGTCIPYAIVLAGDAQVASMVLGQPDPEIYTSKGRFGLEFPGAAPLVHAQLIRGGLCSQQQPFSSAPNREFTGTFSGTLEHSVVAHSGPVSSYRLPAVLQLRRSYVSFQAEGAETVLQDLYPSYDPSFQDSYPQYSAEISPSTQRVTAGEMPLDTQVDASSPAPLDSTGELAWESDETLKPSATLTSIPGQDQTSRWLFWSGILVGLGASLWLWVFQLLADAGTRKEENSTSM